eukprot:COSAG02_NODE_4842_length_4916_cov_2.448204_2_plen_835_part_00
MLRLTKVARVAICSCRDFVVPPPHAHTETSERQVRQLTLRNIDGSRDVCFKIKTTNVGRYVVNPSVGVIPAGQHSTVDIALVRPGLRQTATKDRFLIQAAWSDGSMSADALATFWKTAPPKGMLFQYKIVSVVLSAPATVESDTSRAVAPIVAPLIEEGTPPDAPAVGVGIATGLNIGALVVNDDYFGVTVQPKATPVAEADAPGGAPPAKPERREPEPAGLEPEPEPQPEPQPQPKLEPADELTGSSAARAAALAQMAGTDTWKTWAGRKDGGDGFQLSDLGAAVANFRYNWRQKSEEQDTPPPNGQPCPICDEQEPDADAKGKRWQTLFCGCTVCTSCVRSWMSSEMDDKSGNDPAVKFSCPVCATPMRTSDAHAALSRHPSVTRRYELLSRDATLRTMPEWRSCPNCDGGGFCTPDCLAPRHDQLEEEATTAGWKCQGMMYFLVWLILLNTFRLHPISIHLLAMVGLAAGSHWLQVTARAWVSRVNTEALSVVCPDCESTFLLKDYSVALGHINAADADAESERWIASNTRPCPSCGTAIQKISGCNAMRCGSCRRSFCWACMRSSTACDHFTCRNGAPYGNAKPRANGIGWIQGNPQGVEQAAGGGEREGLLNPAEETAQRILLQSFVLICFSGASTILLIWTALVTAEGGFSQPERLWSIWTAFFALPLKYMIYAVGCFTLYLALSSLYQDGLSHVGLILFNLAVAVLLLYTNVAGWVAWILTAISNIPSFLTAVASVAAATYWWATQPKRLRKRREYEQAPPLSMAEEMQVRIFEAALEERLMLFRVGHDRLFRTRHEMRDHMNLAVEEPWRHYLHEWCYRMHFFVGQ